MAGGALNPFLSLAMQLRRGCLVICLINLVAANHHGWQAGLSGDQDDYDGDIVIEHRHRPRVHKSYGSGQYVIPAGALLTLPEHYPDDDQHEHYQGDDHHEDYLGDDQLEHYQHYQGSGQNVIPAGALLNQHQHYQGGGEVFDGALEATVDYNEDYSMEDNELYLADGFATISRATQGEDGKYVEKREKAQTHDHYMVGGGDVRFANILGDNLGSDETGKEDKKDETLIESDTAAGPSGRVGKKEGSRTALSKLLRLLIAAYI